MYVIIVVYIWLPKLLCIVFATKRRVTTRYNSRRNLERYWFLVSKKHLKIRTFVNINVTTYFALVYNFIVTEGDKKATRLPRTQASCNQ